jgi:hypothetical protein
MKKSRISHKRKSYVRKKSKKKFGTLPPFPPKVDNYTSREKIGTVFGSLAMREAYLDSTEYDKLTEKIKNSAIKEIRDDTLIKSMVKFLKGQGYDIMPEHIKELLLFYNIAVVLSNKM